jgi:hypothetical protein
VCSRRRLLFGATDVKPTPVKCTDMAVTNEAVWAVAKNAARHLIEANQHYKGQRFASALVSAVYAVEETGKMSFLITRGESPKSKRHAAHSIVFFALAKIITDWKWTWEWARILRGGLTPDIVLSDQQQRTMAEHPEYAEIVQQLRAGKLSTLEERTKAFTAAMVAKEERDGTTAQWKPLFEQGLQQDRLLATYVDVTEFGFNNPETTDPDKASALCWLALALLILVVAMAVISGPLKDYKAEIEHMLPDGLIGAEDINRFIQAIKNADTASSSTTPKAEAGS